MQRLIALALAGCSLASAAFGQGSTIEVDFGDAGFPSNGAAATTWNDVTSVSAAAFELLDAQGQATGYRLAFPATRFTGTNAAGTTSPQAGSPLARFPVSATRDTMWGDGGRTVQLQLDQLDPNSTYDFEFAASRTGVGDVRTTDYLVQGFNGALTTLDAANNATSTARVATILPDAAGRITISVRAAASNTNPNRYFYLNALEITGNDAGQRPALIGFDQGAVQISRAQGKPAFQHAVTVRESLGASFAVGLTATDDATGQAPTWLALPSTVTTGTPFALAAGGPALGLGDYSATVVASAAGYPDTRMTVALRVRDPGVRNILFYGNSYSQFNGTVPEMVRRIAQEAGQPAPNAVAQLVGGQNLYYHLTNPTQAAAITSALPLGEEWDYVVMQGFSLEATNVLGDPAAFRANALAILTNVRAHSPQARAVMYQTWARGPGHSVYPGAYPNPLAMHREIRANYRLAVADMNQAFGPGTARDGAVGDTVALLGFSPSLYASDLSHPAPQTTLMAGMVLYTALYDTTVCQLSPDFGGSSPLVTHMAGLGLGAADWRDLGGIADRVADPSLRDFPGSGDDLLLRTGIASRTPTACARKALGEARRIAVSVTSPNAVYAGAFTVLYADAFATGMPPAAHPRFPEIRFGFEGATVLAARDRLGAGLTANVPVLAPAAGTSLLLQAVSFAPSLETGNSRFTTTDGHAVVLR